MSYNIGIPPGTRLQGLIRISDPKPGWELWTGIANAKGNPSSWTGTRLVCYDTGEVIVVTDEIDGAEMIMTIKEPDGG